MKKKDIMIVFDRLKELHMYWNNLQNLEEYRNLIDKTKISSSLLKSITNLEKAIASSYDLYSVVPWVADDSSKTNNESYTASDFPVGIPTEPDKLDLFMEYLGTSNINGTRFDASMLSRIYKAWNGARAHEITKCGIEGCNNLVIPLTNTCSKHTYLCSVKGCTELANERGFCFKHRNREMCSMHGCPNNVFTNGLCLQHFNEQIASKK